MLDFSKTPDGWFRCTPTEEMFQRALETEAVGDKHKPNDMPNFSNRRFQGFVAEDVFDQWLDLQGVARNWNGQTDSRPDFEIGRVSVGVKSCGSLRKWYGKLVVNVYERHREHPLAELFFAGWEHPGAVYPDRATVVLLGGLPAEEYFKRATFRRAGEKLNPRVVAKNDVWNLETRELQPPERWLERICALEPQGRAPRLPSSA